MYSVLPYVIKLCLTKFRLYKVFDYIFSQNEIKYRRYSFNKMTKDNRYWRKHINTITTNVHDSDCLNTIGMLFVGLF